MNRDELKSGMVVELYNGEFGVVLLDTQKGDIIRNLSGINIFLNSYKINLLNHINYEFSIIRIYEDWTLNYIFNKDKLKPEMAIWNRKKLNLVAERRYNYAGKL